MPLTIAKVGVETKVAKVSGNPETRQFLENLGFVVGSSVTLISEIGGNVIVNIRESRVAIGREMACKIMVIAN